MGTLSTVNLIRNFVPTETVNTPGTIPMFTSEVGAGVRKGWAIETEKDTSRNTFTTLEGRVYLDPLSG